MKKIMVLMAAFTFLFSGCAENTEESNTNNQNDTPLVKYTLRFDINTPLDTNEYHWESAHVQNYIEPIEGSGYNPNAYSTGKEVPPEQKGTLNESFIIPNYGVYWYKIDTNNHIIDYDSNNEDAYNYWFSHWNTASDNSGTSYKPGDTIQLTENITLYAVYLKKNSGFFSDDDTNILDIYKTAEFAMIVGDTITLKPSWDIGDNCYYQITSNDFNAIEITDKILTAKSIGTAVVKMISNENPSRAAYCSISVKDKDFEGTAIENILVGTWTYKGSSFSGTLVLNSNKTGHVKATLNSSVVHDNDFTWKATPSYIEISGTGESSLDKQHTIENLKSSSFTMNGYFCFGMPSTTTWKKQ